MAGSVQAFSLDGVGSTIQYFEQPALLSYTLFFMVFLLSIVGL